jgi:uncharacterized membrane protein
MPVAVGREKPKWPYLHPIPVHFPLALFPAAVASLLIYLLTGMVEFEYGAHVMSIFGLLLTPVAIASGFADWKSRYRGQMTAIFKIKIIGAAVLLALALPAVLMRQQYPEMSLLPLDWRGWLHFGLLAFCQIACMIIGHYGGRLVFH